MLLALVFVADARAADKLDDLLVQLRKGGLEDRKKAAYRIAHRHPPAVEAMPALLTALHDPASEVRYAAAVAITSVAGDVDEALPHLVLALRSTRWYTRWRASLELGRFREQGKQAVPHLIAALRNPKRDLRRETILALGQLGPVAAPAAPALVDELDSYEWRIRVSAALAIARIGPAAKGQLKKLHESYRREKHERVRDALNTAIWCVSGFGPDSRKGMGIAWLVECLSSEHPDVRTSAAVALAGWGAEARPYAHGALVDNLSDKRPAVRAAAVETLGKIGAHEATIERMIALATDVSPAVRAQSLQALARVARGNKAVARAAVGALSDKVMWVRLQGLRTLRRVDKAPPGSLSLVKAFFKDPHPAMRREARKTAAAIRGDLPADD